MTGVVIGAAVLAIVLALLNIVLLLAVVRRLSEHETRIAALSGGGAGPPELPQIVAPVGHRVGEFIAASVDGRPVERVGPLLVGFFSPSCDSCHERVPAFRSAAGQHAGSALAVVVRDGKDPDPLVADLDGAATVVVEEPDGPLAAAFAVRGFPAFALLGADGTVRASGYELPLHAS